MGARECQKRRLARLENLIAGLNEEFKRRGSPNTPLASRNFDWRIGFADLSGIMNRIHGARPGRFSFSQAPPKLLGSYFLDLLQR